MDEKPDEIAATQRDDDDDGYGSDAPQFSPVKCLNLESALQDAQSPEPYQPAESLPPLSPKDPVLHVDVPMLKVLCSMEVIFQWLVVRRNQIKNLPKSFCSPLMKLV